MTKREERALWAKLAKVIGPGRKITAVEQQQRYDQVMKAHRAGRDPYGARP